MKELLAHTRLAVVLLGLECGPHASSADTTNQAGRVQQVQLQGRVVCLPEEMHQRHGTELPTRHQHVWGFKATNGVCYTLLEGKFSEALLHDQRVRAKELRLKARLLPRTQILEVTYFHSVKNGVVQNLYYYCEICAITTVSPEVCACCQAPVQLVEKPLTEKED